ncbi:hypothetical protein ANRL1_01726 [Anaerolineae bacterium]|nr:hypothetical protein ANRL1_01726 [Anaerolineae bacterium]
MRSIILDLFNILFVPRYRYTDGYTQLRARVTLALAVIIAFVTLTMVILIIAVASRVPGSESQIALSLGALLVQIILIGLIHSGQANLATVSMFGVLLTFTLLVMAVFTIDLGSFMIAALTLIYGGLCFVWWAQVPTTVFLLIAFAITATLQYQGVISSPTVIISEAQVFPRLMIGVGILSMIGFLTAIVSIELRRGIGISIRTIRQFRSVAEVAELSAGAGTLADLLQRTVGYIRDRFGFFHVQVFLVDSEKRYANLVASTGELGELLMQRGYRLTVASQTAVGRALHSAEPAIGVGYSSGELTGRANELLRDMRSELALPLIVGENVIGVLHIQSARPDAFHSEEVDSLRILSTQVAAIVYNGRQLEEARIALNETRRLLLETEVSLRDAQRLNQRLTGEAWESYLKSRNAEIIGYTLSENRLFRDSSWTPALEQAAGKHRPVLTTLGTESGASHQLVAVPIELRGRVIGAIEVEMEGTARQAEMLDVLQSVSQRLALSIDNARLFEQAQELAQRELEVNAISARLQGMNDIDDLAKSALQELSRALGASQALLRLGMPTENSSSAAAGKGKSS